MPDKTGSFLSVEEKEVFKTKEDTELLEQKTAMFQAVDDEKIIVTEKIAGTKEQESVTETIDDTMKINDEVIEDEIDFSKLEEKSKALEETEDQSKKREIKGDEEESIDFDAIEETSVTKPIYDNTFF